MNDKVLHNIPASIRQRLLNISREQKEDFGLTLTRYAIERLLARLGYSKFVNQFVLKGAQLFPLWMDMPHRPTRDLDLLCQGNSEISTLEEIFREICMINIEPSDGIIFIYDSVKGELIREDALYEGVRINLQFNLSGAKDTVQVDIGVGDAVFPLPETVEMPSILGFSPVCMRVYPKESVIAEKLEAMVVLGIRNSRMKDFYDLWVLSKMFSFDGLLLSKAINATFQRRKTTIPTLIPFALTEEFWKDSSKQLQWKAFNKRIGNDDTLFNLEVIIKDLYRFIVPILQSILKNESYIMVWNYIDGWQVPDDMEK